MQIRYPLTRVAFQKQNTEQCIEITMLCFIKQQQALVLAGITRGSVQ